MDEQPHKLGQEKFFTANEDAVEAPNTSSFQGEEEQSAGRHLQGGLRCKVNLH